VDDAVAVTLEFTAIGRPGLGMAPPARMCIGRCVGRQARVDSCRTPVHRGRAPV